MDSIYFDNASTSFPKSKKVLESISDFIQNTDGSYNRTESTEESDYIFETRRKLAELIGVKYPTHIIFTSNATEALNTIILGFANKNANIVSTVTEHNSVIRPLTYLQKIRNITVDWAKCDRYGLINVDELIDFVDEKTDLVIVNHGSNVTGQVQPIAEICKCVKQKGDIPILIDMSQTLGHIEIDNNNLEADFIVFTGHKALKALSGIGGFYINPKHTSISPLKVGGTGVLSELLSQPRTLPYYFESGTLNYPGIFSLYCSLSEMSTETLKNKKEYIYTLTDYLINKLTDMHNIDIYSNANVLGIVSFNIKGMIAARVSSLLQKENIKTRSGLLCAPFLHHHIHDNVYGCVRISLSESNTKEETDKLIDILEGICNKVGEYQNIKLPRVYELPIPERKYFNAK